MAYDITSYASGYTMGPMTYDQFQQQQTLAQLQFNLQQAVQTAYNTRIQLAQQGVDAAKAEQIRQLTALDAVNSHSKTIEATRFVQNYQNNMQDRNIANMRLAAQDLAKSLSFNVEQMNKIIAAKRGEQIAQGSASGVIATQGSKQDVILQTISESEKDLETQFKTDNAKVKQAYDQALNMELAKAFNNWRVETQIDFSNQVLKSNLY